MDIDYAIRKDEPPAVTEESTPAAVALYERWERSNRLSVMFIKTKVTAGIRGSVDQHEKVRDLLKSIDDQFVTSEKALATQLKKLEVDMSESFLVHYILNSLPAEYGPFKISYNTHKDKWSINELMTMCVQEEERLAMEQGESALLTTTRGKNKAIKTDKAQANQKGKFKIPPQGDIKKEDKCFFCKKGGHMKKQCPRFKEWLEKKGYAKPKEASGK
ncbi:unnamed protein product [Trifolium pratense]|uniref:Uncharacterized protein n=1 Tax=Trifolium pratense TaxID=57577 RepID=A0ACB0KZP0_TRIPR|nr:unnamed protein product [Trifolium pratense]